jgi:hypothetical protein
MNTHKIGYETSLETNVGFEVITAVVMKGYNGLQEEKHQHERPRSCDDRS